MMFWILAPPSLFRLDHKRLVLIILSSFFAQNFSINFIPMIDSQIAIKISHLALGRYLHSTSQHPFSSVALHADIELQRHSGSEFNSLFSHTRMLKMNIAVSSAVLRYLKDAMLTKY